MMSHTADPVKLVAFDLDDTLAPSKSPTPPAIATALTELLAHVPVCVISGGRFEQFQKQLLPALDLSPHLAGRLHLMPTCGTRYLRYQSGQWKEIYARNLPAEHRCQALAVLEEKARELGVWEEDTWGPALEDRGSQITYSALGQQAPVSAKMAWDPSGEKKNRLRDAVARELPDLEVRSGGSTSVDITARGVDKAYGMRQLATATDIGLEAMVFVGDRLDPHGNDYPVLELGVECIAVADWEETAGVITRLCERIAGNTRA